jgi:SNF2 family DNA or RNA helicase
MAWSITTPLLPHQQAAVEKLRTLKVWALFMEPGTGKTLTTMELLRRKQARIKRIVWCCPANLPTRTGIAAEWCRHSTLDPQRICIVRDALKDRERAMAAYLVIVGLESISGSDRLTLLLDELIDEHTAVVVDESDLIKGPMTKRGRRLVLLGERARYRAVLTGTPMTQGVPDLYMQCRFLDRSILGYASYWSFAANHIETLKTGRGKRVRILNPDLIALKVAPYAYQVTKDEALTLPPKVYAPDCTVALTPDQWDAYQEAKDTLLLNVPDSDLSPVHLYRLFTALQQIVCGFWHADGITHIYSHRRIDRLLEYVATIPREAKVIVWAKYVRCIDEIVAALTTHYGDTAVARHDGTLSMNERDVAINRFRTTARFLVGTPQTGGRGLTLNEATHTVFYANDWNWATRVQAEDRCHRVGQTQTVTYVSLVSPNTIDERILNALYRKESLASAFRNRMQHVKQKSRRELGKVLREIVEELT